MGPRYHPRNQACNTSERTPSVSERMFDAHPHPFLGELNVEQRAAATHSGETLLILAGAGTGKTTTLCARVAWLMAEGVPAERILLLTFTRRAAREMIERARTLAERVAPDAGRIVGRTFHSVAHRMVRAHATSLGLEAGFGVLDAGGAGDLLDLVRQEHGGPRAPAFSTGRNDARHLFAHVQRPDAPDGGPRRVLSPV